MPGIRPEEKESGVRGGGGVAWGRWRRGTFLLGTNFKVFSQIMKEGNFASTSSIAVEVWLFIFRSCWAIAGTIDIKVR